ncbi:MAG: enoyl-CoA hydratase/isomerase family protein [Chitinophagaceae bacterium]|jgi:methylglutaconyl-CoA hydratase|uniref:enoyl-CoA hydratase/isomerase family protein n=1 Tax=unclassified Paraflavitalea TaxID=2798305 RepID=UPI003D33F3E1|nr:enoyl-CoA hydratase/isomerase family protein [Chitinophagaceae bacterium]
MNTAYVKTTVDNHIAQIEFYHPQSNSLPAAILEELSHAIVEAGKDHNIRVIVLRSAGEKAFCAGASFDELIAIETEEQGKKFFSGFAHVINAIRTSSKFVIARIQGKCVGGGVGIAAAADYAIALDTASVKLSELAVGIGPFVVGPAVERKIGKAAFCELSIDAGNWRSATWAKERGLFTDLYSTAEVLDDAVNKLTLQLMNYNPDAMAALKKIQWEGTEHWEHLLFERAAISGSLVLSEFTRAAIQKFKKA